MNTKLQMFTKIRKVPSQKQIWLADLCLKISGLDHPNQIMATSLTYHHPFIISSKGLNFNIMNDGD